VEKQLAILPRAEIARQAINNSYIIITSTLEEAMGFSNEYAPEHLILATEKWSAITPKIINAGSVFLGNLTPESVGDYASGTNHTLPTSSYSRAYSGCIGRFFCKEDHLPVFNRRRHTKYRPGGRDTGRYGGIARA
jgi:histidinol dehydrogenase